MQYNGPTFELPPTVLDRLYSPGIVVERMLRVWSISRWRGSRGFAEWFLRAGSAHLPAGSPVMFQLDDVGPISRTPPIGLTVTFTNIFNVSYLLGKVFCCGCEFIVFTTHNIYTNFDCIFPTRGSMHSLPYYIGQDDMEREQ
ncbi:Auxin-induced protein 5NG4 [Hordeum vulgare]|nr:Auxin-induced protein 5NG4 [Hordeum vulgare]